MARRSKRRIPQAAPKRGTQTQHSARMQIVIAAAMWIATTLVTIMLAGSILGP